MQRRTEGHTGWRLLPQTLTPFVGRREEITDLKRLLSTEDCRLLTVVGADGIGKTRLAIEAASQWQETGGGATFVDLQPVQATNLLLPAIAEGLGLTQSGEEAYAAFGDYYTRFLQEIYPELNDGRQQEALWELDVEMDNMRAA